MNPNKSKTSLNIAPPVKLNSYRGELTWGQNVDLLDVLYGIHANNKMVSESVSRWLVKNMTKLEKMLNNSRNEMKAIWEEFAEKDKNGNMLYWDGTEAGKTAILYSDGKLINCDGVEEPMDGKLFPHILKENQPAYSEKIQELQEKSQVVTLIEIQPDLIEKLNIPLQKTNPPKPLNIALFYETLVIDDDKEEETDEVPQNGKLEVV